ncbi:MAG TPA: hypothetical protein VMT71_15155 [Syntrophorhabdales bacterium]|nr:hypothetical protein [Syntrophorhabdales bacterium]
MKSLGKYWFDVVELPDPGGYHLMFLERAGHVAIQKPLFLGNNGINPIPEFRTGT